MAINLSNIIFRNWSDKDITTFGPNDYIKTVGAVDLRRIKFRAWQNPGIASIGGIEPPPPPPPPIGQGNYSILIDGSADQYVFNSFSAVTSVYLKTQIYISSSQYISMLSSEFSGDILAIIGDDNFDYQGIYVTNRNSSNVEDGNLYFYDYWSPPSSKILIAADQWYNVEIAIRPFAGANPWEGAFAVNGTISSWNDFDDFGAITSGYIKVYIGDYVHQSTDGFYLDNAAYNFTDWVIQSGFSDFEDDFESGDLSAWDGNIGSPSLVTPP